MGAFGGNRTAGTLNSVYAWGWNLDSAGVIDNTKPYLGESAEYSYQPPNPSTETWCERHWLFKAAAHSSQRYMTMVGDWSSGLVQMYIQINSGGLRHQTAGAVMTDLLTWTSADALSVGVPMRREVNNAQTINQLKYGGGGYIYLPWVNSRDEITLGYNPSAPPFGDFVPVKSKGYIVNPYASIDAAPTPIATEGMIYLNSFSGELQYRDSSGNTYNLTKELYGGKVFSVTKASTDTNNATTTATTTTGSELIVVAVGWYGAGTPPALTDSRSNTWTALTTETTPDLNGNVKMYYCVNPTTDAAHTFGVTSTATYPSIVVIGLEDMDASPFGAEAAGAGANSAATIQPGSVTPNEASCVVLTALCWNETSGVEATINNSFAAINRTPVSGQAVGCALGWKRQETAAAVNPTWTSAGVTTIVTSGVWFKP